MLQLIKKGNTAVKFRSKRAHVESITPAAVSSGEMHRQDE